MAGQPTKTILDLQRFAASTLADNKGLAVALKVLESCLAGPDVPLALIVQDLCAVPNLFEFIVSASRSEEGLVLVRRILDAYPTNPALIETSSAGILLRRLSSVLFALPPYLFPSDIVRDEVGRNKVYVENALAVLRLLCLTECSSFGAVDPACTFSARDRELWRSKNENQNTFHELGMEVPSNNAEASRTARKISTDLKAILRFYLDLLLEPSFAQQLSCAYISTDAEAAVHSSAQQAIEVTETSQSEPSAHPNVQPLKAVLSFNNANKFGEWRVIVSTNTTRRLCELANSDRRKCHEVVNKMRHLSKGRFSGENFARLNGPSGVPIFEAKVQRDLWLVYQIDVVPDHDERVERQVIKVYGIYTHTPCNGIWDVIGKHLATNGEEYCNRCALQAPMVHCGSYVYLPACFPLEGPQNDTKRDSLVLSDEDMEEMHSLLVLEKYVTFSQVFLNSLIANKDVEHIFELTPQERKIVECTTSCYVLGRSGTGKTTTMLFKILGIQWAWETQTFDMPKPRQVFVTKSHFLATKVQEYFSKLLESLALAGCSLDDLKRMHARSIESGMADPEDEDQVGIPQKYSELEDRHFPLFVTFDKLARMIAADVIGADPKQRPSARLFVNTDEVRAQESIVTYDVFARSYWPHLSRRLTKGLEPWLVFSEFMGIIKGSEQSLSYPDGFLDEEAYCSLPARSNPVFADQRQTIYAIFRAYCNLKKQRRHHDLADRTRALLKTLMGGTSLRGQKVDYLYVDEAQDNLLIDAFLLRLICRNPDGLFWAGDTAQTISAGSSFRFNDLKAFLYRIERAPTVHVIQDRSFTEPATFQLAINYRSHGGIVNCAHTVIERITRFWPHSIDALQPELGIVDGLKPRFFRDWDQGTLKRLLSDGSESYAGLGAHQCILVRNEEAVETLCKEIGKVGLIMTLYDSKGLEFDDVLLYNFFEDSTVDVSRWRVLLNHLSGDVDGQDLVTINAPPFRRDEGRFARVCSELKSLYVGITRAKKNLWIFDKSDKGEPMRMIWTSRNQIQNYMPGMDAPRFAASHESSPAEWEALGHDLFKQKKYPQAKYCFERALLPRMVAICEAFRLREVARAQVDIAPRKAQQDAFLNAANAFVGSGNDAPLARDKLHYYHNAADCFLWAGDDRKAAAAYLAAEECDLAARLFRKAGLFGKTLKVLHEHSWKIPSESVQELYTVCRLSYCRRRDGVRPRSPLFSSFEEELQFCETYDLDFAQTLLLENHGRYLEAAELHLSEHRPFNAIEDFLKMKDSQDAVRKAAKIVLDGLWWRCSFGVTPKEVAANDSVDKLLRLAGELPPDFLDPLDRDEISMFRAIAQANLPSLRELSRTFLKEERNAAALLALNHCFTRLPLLKCYALQDMSIFLDEFQRYVRLLRNVVSHPDPLSDVSIKRLFWITETSNVDYAVESSSILHSFAAATGGRHRPASSQVSIIALSKKEMVTVLRKYLMGHLYEQVTKENKQCLEAMAFSQPECLMFIVNGLCNHVDHPHDHVKSADLVTKWYNLRISIHLQQIRILQVMYSTNYLGQSSVLAWLARLYDAFNPQSHIQGSFADFNLSMISGSHGSLAVMKAWVQDALYALQADYDRPAFLTNMLKLIGLIFAFDRPSALRCITRGSRNARQARVKKFMYRDGRHILEDIVCLFDGTHETCISAGLSFLRHVLESALFIDLSVFCDCLEEIVGKISISWGLSSPCPLPLNGLVLPRSWLGTNKDFSTRKEIRIDLMTDVLDRLRDLMILLQSECDGVNRMYSFLGAELTPVNCDVFIARICRALSLLHHNMSNPEVRNKVESIFSALGTAGVMHELYQKYMQTPGSQYLEVMAQYDADMEVVAVDLVQLLHNERDLQRFSPLRLHRIQYIEFADRAEIASLLAARLEATCSNPSAHPLAVIFRADHTERAEDRNKERKVETGDVHEVEPVLSRIYMPTIEEISATMKIKAAYRMYRKHREAQARAVGKGLKARRNAVFIECIRNVYASGWGRTPYRTLYLWALPHLVVCLDKAISIAQKLKSETKDSLLNCDHERLEESGEKMSMIHALLKDGHDLCKMIEPNAAIHQAKDKAIMKQAVLDVKDFVHRLPTSTPDSEVHESLRVAYELAVINRQQLPRRGQR